LELDILLGRQRMKSRLCELDGHYVILERVLLK
jgi:hypothetical protein